LALGQVDAAVAEFRSALAHTPRDNRIRAALGLALVQSRHFGEAASYLAPVAAAEPQNGPVWRGLAEIARAGGDGDQALELLRQALSKEWPASAEPQRREAQLEYAELLAAAGRQSEADTLLLSVIAQRGDDPVIAKKAAEMIRENGSAEQVDQAYTVLASHFPGDSGIWLELGNARLAEAKDVAAREAYQRALKLAPEDAEARDAVARIGEILSVDPTRRGLSVRERARRWDEILERVVNEATSCGPNPEAAKAGPLLKQKAGTLRMSDRKMEAALSIWKSTDQACRKDPVLAHIMSKVIE
jgi:tetratricopeptide (TPR) repeat protein